MTIVGSVVVHFSEHTRRQQMSYDAKGTVANAFSFASLHIAGSRQSPDAKNYAAYAYGQRVPFDELLVDIAPKDIEFRRIGGPGSPTVKREGGSIASGDFPASGHSGGPASSAASPVARTSQPASATKRSRVAALIDAALVKAERESGELPPQPARAQPAAEGAVGDDDGVIVISDDDADVSDVELPIVIGSVAQYQGPKAPELLTHQWTVYVRGENNEDLSPLIEKVEIRLHDTFPNPVRVLTAPPFEVTEKGWGQFTVGIRIFVRGVSGPGSIVGTTHFISFSPPNTIVDAAGRVVPKPATPVAAVGNRPHCIPPFGLPFSRAPDVIPPFALIKAPVVVERRDAIVVRNAPEEVREAAAQCTGRQAPRAALSVWPEVRAHLALPAGIEWERRTTDHAREIAELTQIRDALAMEVSRTLMRVQQQNSS